MLADNQQDSTASQMSDLFGEPPLMKGEDKARYWRLHAAVTHEFKPKMDFEKLCVREYTDTLWQQQRYKQSAASIVEGNYVEALASLLRPFISPSISIDEDPATKMARDYYSGEADNKREKELEFHLAVHGISSEQIRAKAMQLCGSSIQLFIGMQSHCENSLRMLRKERDRRPAIEVPNVSDPDKEGGARI
jgi:hypothetical protein